MPDDKQVELNRRIQLLHDKYCKQLPEKYQEIEDYWTTYLTDLENPQHMETFYRLVHTLKGTAATFGFTSQSGSCFKIQSRLLDIKESKRVLNDEDIRLIQTYLNELRANISTPADHLPGKP